VDRTGLGVVGTIDQTLDPRMDQGTGTHGARFNCSKQLTVLQAVVTNEYTSFAEGNDLGVGRGIAAGEVAVPALGDDFAGGNNHRAHRDFPGFEGTLGGAKSGFHEEFIGSVVGRGRTVVRRWSLVVRYSSLSVRILATTMIAYD